MAPPKSGFVDREPSARTRKATAADVAKSERERRPSLDDEEEAAMEAKHSAFQGRKGGGGEGGGAASIARREKMCCVHEAI